MSPAVSRAQYRYFQAVAHGGVHQPGLPAAKAREYVAGQAYKNLPARSPATSKKTKKGRRR
jgi:hypothetical protein